MKVSCGRISDGMVETMHRWELSGRTFPVKDRVKAMGFRWDPSKKVWWLKWDKDTSGLDLCHRILRGD
jgi:hypothetical protein